MFGPEKSSGLRKGGNPPTLDDIPSMNKLQKRLQISYYRPVVCGRGREARPHCVLGVKISLNKTTLESLSDKITS